MTTDPSRATTPYDRLRDMLANHPEPNVRRWILLGYSPFLKDEPYLFPMDLLTEGLLLLALHGSGNRATFWTSSSRRSLNTT